MASGAPRDSDERLPPAKEFVADLGDGGLETMRWLEKNWHVLAEYPRKWVVLAHRRVCFADESLDEVLAEADAAGVPGNEQVVLFVDDVARSYGTARL